MHTHAMKESEGVLSDFKWSNLGCRVCKREGVVRYQVWESNCGGYEDLKYTCTVCDSVWWVDGIDS